MMPDDDGPIVEDVLGQHRKAKARRLAAVNSKRKGTNFQSDVANLLEAAYPGEIFSSTPGSGGIATARRLDKVASEVLSGDLMNSRYMFKVEAKKGYDDVRFIDLFAAIGKPGSKTSQDTVWGFISQAEEESKQSGKEPLIIWSQTRKPVICILRQSTYMRLSAHFDHHTVMHWRGYTFFPFEEMLRIPKEIVFKDG